jgi:hypothetical protein
VADSHGKNFGAYLKAKGISTFRLFDLTDLTHTFFAQLRLEC